MRVFTTCETRWHDPDAKSETIVPAGEPCQTVLPKDIPIDSRGTIEAGIKQYATQGRTFRAIKIRGWFAMIDATWLTFVVPVGFKESAPTARARTGSPGRPLASCATD